MPNQSVQSPGQSDTTTPNGGWTNAIVISFIAMILVQEFIALSYTTVAIATPEITVHFATTQAGWLLTGFLLVSAVVSPLFGKLADLHGKRRMLLIAMSIALVGAVVSVTAQNMAMLIIGRCLEGAVGVGLFLTYSLMRDVYPPKVLPLAASMSLTGSGIFGAFVPLMAGSLLDAYGFRGLFALDVVILAVLLVLVRLSTAESDVRKPATLDIVGSLMIGAGLAMILVAISKGADWGWASGRVIGLFVFGAVLAIGFVLRSRRVTEPLIDLRLFSRRPILMAAIAGALAYAGFTITSSIFPMIGQTPAGLGGDYGLGMTATKYAALATPYALSIVAGGIIVGKLVVHVGGRTLMVVGCLLVTLGGLSVSLFMVSYWQLAVGAVITGLGAGLVMGAVPNIVIAHTPAEDQGSISSGVTTVTSMMTATAPIVMFAILNANATEIPGVYLKAGYSHAALLVAALGGAAFVLLLTVFAKRRMTAPLAPTDS
ncbi:MFS transporter [Gordonia sp. NPDC127522]|uniref:MFS transporter n=1 Tax=Gordonia sp. NPDC127522 TaxID=3345390 RepID=UPI00363FCBEC